MIMSKLPKGNLGAKLVVGTTYILASNGSSSNITCKFLEKNGNLALFVGGKRIVINISYEAFGGYQECTYSGYYQQNIFGDFYNIIDNLYLPRIENGIYYTDSSYTPTLLSCFNGTNWTNSHFNNIKNMMQEVGTFVTITGTSWGSSWCWLYNNNTQTFNHSVEQTFNSYAYPTFTIPIKNIQLQGNVLYKK